MMEPAPIRSVAILGAGLSGLSAAAAFAGALPEVAITVIDCPPDPAALADRMPGTLPAIHRFHGEIGLDRAALIERGIAFPRLGTRVQDWRRKGESWFGTFGHAGRPLRTTPFHHLWVRARAIGKADALHAYSAAGRLAEAGRFDLPGNGREDDFDWGLSLDPHAYRGVLERLCLARGVSMVTGSLAAAERDERDFIETLVLEDGRHVAADLYVDCAGPKAPLLRMMDLAFESWSGWLPDGEVVLRQRPPDGTRPPRDVAQADASGWRWTAPSPSGAIECIVGGPDPMADSSERVSLAPGRRPRPWIGNVVALGDAACAVDPLHATNLHLAQSGVRRALSLLPDRRFGTVEIAEFNRRSTEETSRVRDFLALHHLRRNGATSREPPDSLAHTLAQFARRGRLPFYEEETFTPDSWINALLNLGVVPELSAAIAGDVPVDELLAFLDRVAADLR